MPEADLEALEADVKAEIEDAVKFAEESPAADEYKQYVTKPDEGSGHGPGKETK